MSLKASAPAKMPEHLVFRDFPDDQELKKRARELWERRWKKMERLLESFAPDQRHLRVVFSQNQHHKRLFEVRAVLMLPTGTLVADAEAYQPKLIDAVDRVADQLEREIIRHKGLLRHDYLYRRKRRRQEDLAGIRPMLEAHHRKEERAQFMELLRPALRNIEADARRELLLAQLEGAIRPKELTVSDLLDAVAARAWDRFRDRPAAKPLERWLIQILYEVIDEKRGESSPAVSIHDKVPKDDPHFRADAGRIEKNEPFWDQVEPLLLEQVLPNEAIAEPLEQLATEEQQRLILAQLASYPREKRRAFTLHVLEGWEIDDIAEIQRRSPEQVRSDIEAVRQGLRERLQQSEKPRASMEPAGNT